MFVRVMMWFYYISSPGCTATNLHRLHLPYRRFNNPLLSHVGTLRCHHTCECCFALPIWLSKACYVSFSRMAGHLELPFGVSVLGLASGISMLPLSWAKLSLKKRPKKRPMKVPRLPEAAASRGKSHFNDEATARTDFNSTHYPGYILWTFFMNYYQDTIIVVELKYILYCWIWLSSVTLIADQRLIVQWHALMLVLTFPRLTNLFALVHIRWCLSVLARKERMSMLVLNSNDLRSS